jgi:SAM-dependent methyltransferase
MISDFFEVIKKLNIYKNPDRLRFYADKYLFKDINFKGKRFLDIGGGRGLFGIFAMFKGASGAVIIEPEFDGSTKGVENDFYLLKNTLGINNIHFVKDLLQDYKENEKFDVILLHNSINHLDEEACQVLHSEKDAKEKYINILKLISEITNINGELIVCDCSRNSLFSDLGVINPFAPSIEWNKHQKPELWIELLEQVGFTKVSLEWSSYNILKYLGRILMGNRLMAYLTFSHFKIRLIKK